MGRAEAERWKRSERAFDPEKGGSFYDRQSHETSITKIEIFEVNNIDCLDKA